MHPSRTSAAAARRRTGLVSLLTVSFTAALGATAADLSVPGARPLPAALECTALLAGAAALRVSRTRAGSDTQATDEMAADEDGASRPADVVEPRARREPVQGRIAPPPSRPGRPSAVPPRTAASPLPRTTRQRQAQPQPHSPSRPRPAWQIQPMPASASAPPEDPHASARRAFVNLARRIQAAVNRQLRDLRELEARHGGDPEVFGDLLQVDHATALIGRLADSLAVLGGDQPSRRWQRPIPVVNVLRGAMSRITEYRRVEIGPLPERTGVDGAAVEALVHALAELLDNATRYSPPDSRVRLGARVLDGGCVIEVVDAGVGLTPATAQRAEFVLRTRDFGLELASLGESPQLGLAVVGRLAHSTGFEASLHRAEGGGVRAEIRVPARLLREMPEAEPVPAKPEQRPHSHRAAQVRPAVPTATSTVVGTTPHGLPRRRRAGPADGNPQAPTTTVPDGNGAPGARRSQAASAAPPPAPGLWLSAFQAGLRGEAVHTAGHGESGDEASRGDGRNPV